MAQYQLSEETIKQLKDASAFQEYMKFVVSCIEELNTVEGFSKMSRDDAGAIGQASDIAKNQLYKMLSPFINFKERREPTEKEKEEAGKRFGLS